MWSSSANVLRGKAVGAGEFTLSVYPSSMPVCLKLARNGVLADLMASGAIIKTAFCGPCFGAGNTQNHNGFSIRHTTRNLPNWEGSKPGNEWMIEEVQKEVDRNWEDLLKLFEL